MRFFLSQAFTPRPPAISMELGTWWWTGKNACEHRLIAQPRPVFPIGTWYRRHSPLLLIPTPGLSEPVHRLPRIPPVSTRFSRLHPWEPHFLENGTFLSSEARRAAAPLRAS